MKVHVKNGPKPTSFQPYTVSILVENADEHRALHYGTGFNVTVAEALQDNRWVADPQSIRAILATIYNNLPVR